MVYIALLMNNPEHRGAPKECYIEPPSRVSTNNAPKRGRTLASAIREHIVCREEKKKHEEVKLMAAVLRSAARRLAAAEMGLHRLPLHSQFWLEIVGHRMKGPQNPCPMIFRKRISGVDADKAEAVFLDVMMMAKYDGNVPPNMMSSPVRALLRKALIRYMKIKWFIKEIALSLKIRVVFKLGKLNFAVICVLLYVTYGRPLSLLRRFWKILNSQGGDDSE
uniref:Uncharacterized protein n=1 Tax=Aegilops tauschii TaxID=37682 RepID=M8CA00_AEGTA